MTLVVNLYLYNTIIFIILLSPSLFINLLAINHLTMLITHRVKLGCYTTSVYTQSFLACILY